MRFNGCCKVIDEYLTRIITLAPLGHDAAQQAGTRFPCKVAPTEVLLPSHACQPCTRDSGGLTPAPRLRNEAASLRSRSRPLPIPRATVRQARTLAARHDGRDQAHVSHMGRHWRARPGVAGVWARTRPRRRQPIQRPARRHPIDGRHIMPYTQYSRSRLAIRWCLCHPTQRPR